MEEHSARPGNELRVRYYPRRVRPGADGVLTPSQAVRLVERAGQAAGTDEPRQYVAAGAPVTPEPAPDMASSPPAQPETVSHRGRHRAARSSWWSRLRTVFGGR